jgi:hypothetical protein
MPQKKRRRWPTAHAKKRFPNPILVSIPEFVRRSGLGHTLTRQLIEGGDGALPVRVIGTRRWIIREEAEAWLRKQAKPRTAA